MGIFDFIIQRTKIEEKGLNREADIIFLIVIATMIGGSIYAAKTGAWAGTYYIQAIIIPLIAVFVIECREKSSVLAHLLVMGVIIGIFELFADFLLVDVMKILVYTTQDPRIISSPLNMPISWMSVVITQGYLLLRITNYLESKTDKKVYADITGSLIGGIIAGITIGFYETIAYQAHWWEYINASFVVMEHTPLVIPLAEFIMFAAFLPWFRLSTRKAKKWIVISGFGFGMMIAVAYTICFYLLEAIAAIW